MAKSKTNPQTTAAMERRTFLEQFSSGLALAGLAAVAPRSAWATGNNRRVAILGGGVGGLSAAHELIERGFEVAVYEAKSIGGGKARSMPVAGTAQNGRRDLPGEHGFRFFAGFYKHLPHTMARIPFGNNPNGVLDNLATSSRIQFARVGEPEILIPTHLPRSINDLEAAIEFLFGSNLGLSKGERQFFLKKLLVLLGSCDERRWGEYEHISWWNYIEAEGRSPSYQKFLATGLMRNLVACKPKLVSTRTGGYIFLQLLLSALGQNNAVDRHLNGPTNDAWIDPWIEYLKSRGVAYYKDSPVEEIVFDGQRVTGARIRQGGQNIEVVADHYISAVPVEVMEQLVTPAMSAADPALGKLKRLRTEWMNGFQFYLKEDAPLVAGHSIYYDSPWAITSISQRQFWSRVDLSQYGDGAVKGILSVDISDWNTPGIVYGKPAQNCTAQEIKDEVWAQLKAHLNEPGNEILRDDHILGWHLDPAIAFPSLGQATNAEPLLINTTSSWDDRPEASGAIPNLFLASDYVKTHSDLACMEAANEAARRAVNAILERTGSSAPRCQIWKLKEPQIFAALKEYDQWRYRRGLPYDETKLPPSSIRITS